MKFLDELNNLKGIDYGSIKSLDFEDFIVKILEKFGKVKRQIWVNNRGDGRRGRVDIVLDIDGENIGIEIDRMTPRKKSIFKLQQLGYNNNFVITRSPFNIIKIY